MHIARVLAVVLAAFVCSSPVSQDRPALPSPGEFLGAEVGADHFLADHAQLIDYWRELVRRSDRMLLEDCGRTGYGQTQWVAVISAPDNLARLEELRDSNRRLALGRDADPAPAAALARSGRAVVWIDAGMHATESVAAQNILELVWQMVSRDDAEVRRILDEVVLLVCPANPDGMDMVARAYMSTGRVGGLPVLYQRYAGHDNNRDHYAGNLAETRNVQRMLYRRWLPQVVYNHHQSAPRGTILFTPPFRDPFNYNVDPLVIRGIERVAAHINHRLTAEGRPGVISRSGASYSTWWNGGLRTTVYFHNQIGILTEAFGSPTPTRVVQTLSRRLPYSDYPDPVPTQEWHARQTIDYLQSANFAILDLVARFREEFQLDAWRMARRSIERGSRDHWTPQPDLLAIANAREEVVDDERAAEDATEPLPPAFEDPELRDARIYVLPADQPDVSAVVRLVRRLRRTGIEVHRLTAESELPDGRSVAAGSFVLFAAQAFRPHLRDMLEPQWHPDDRSGGGEPVRPYDSAGWTLSMQMGVEVVRLLDPHWEDGVSTGLLEPVVAVEVPFPRRDLPDPASGGYLLDPADSNTVAVVFALWQAGVEVFLSESTESVGSCFAVEGTDAARAVLARHAKTLGVEVQALAGWDSAEFTRLSPVRVGLFDEYGGDMATGWTEWVLDTFGIPFERVFGDRVHRGDLAADFDVLLFQTGLPAVTRRDQRDAALRRGRDVATDEQVANLRAVLPPFEDWSTLESRNSRLVAETTAAALRSFVEAGGTVMAFGRQCELLVRHLELDLEFGIEVAGSDGDDEERVANSSEFFVPGSLLRVDWDPSHPLNAGISPRQVLMFRRSPVLRSIEDASYEVLARYSTASDILASGWGIGTELLGGLPAVVRKRVGAGAVVLVPADLLYRGQPVGSFKLLFNVLMTAAAGR